MGCFVVAEAGVNHNGSEELALRLIDAAILAQADAVKFQTFKAEKLVRAGADKAEYQRRQTGEGDQLAMLKALELPEESFRRLATHCQERGIEFMSTAFDESSFDFLVKAGIRRVKIPSGELTNLPFIAYMAKHDLPIVLSTGMATMDEVAEAVEVVASTTVQGKPPVPLRERLTLLHCTSNYPASPEEVNLRAMRSMAERFSLPVGYSDHTAGTFVAPLAVSLGAVVIEKHFTLDRNLPGPDHAASLEPADLQRMVRDIRRVETVLGSAAKQPTQAELEVRRAARRSVTLVQSVRAGQRVDAAALALMRPGDGIPPRDLPRVIGRQAARDLEAGHTLQWADLQ